MSDTEASADNVEETKTIIFDKPITVNGKNYDSIDLREPNGDEVDQAQRITFSPMAQNMELIARVAGVPLAVVRKLPVSKINEASEFFKPFLEGSPATSES